tara:strand:+ start:551 stop:925 length:375 start_codon:yes stop_codon:yes gene_type:complete
MDSNQSSNTNIPIHHKTNMRNIVMRQTDYDEKTADLMLEQYNYDVMSVVRGFLNPKPLEKKNDGDEIVTSANQQIYGEIRGMMDNASMNYRKQKEAEEMREMLRQEYIKRRESAKKNLVTKIEE